MLDRNTWNYLTECKKVALTFWKIKLPTNESLTVYTHTHTHTHTHIYIYIYIYIYITLCKQMSSESFKNVIYYLCV